MIYILITCQNIVSRQISSENWEKNSGSIILYCVVLYCIVLYCIILYCIVLYCIVLYCIVLYCIVLYVYWLHKDIVQNHTDYRNKDLKKDIT